MNIRWLAPILLAPLTLFASEHAAKAERDASAALAKGLPFDAVVTLERVPKGARSDRADLLLAESYFQLGELDKAASLATGVAESSKGRSTDAWLLIARIERRNDNFEGARAAASKAILASPTRAEAYLLLGQALDQLGDGNGADGAYATYRLLTNRAD
jgi:Flp pilus assembly protein TadD